MKTRNKIYSYPRKMHAKVQNALKRRRKTDLSLLNEKSIIFSNPNSGKKDNTVIDLNRTTRGLD